MEILRAVVELILMLLTDSRTAVLFLILIIASVIDSRTHKIPNWLTASGAVFGLAYNTMYPIFPQAGFMWAFEGLLLGFLIMLPFYALRVMGAGDVKLMAMTGAFLGFPDIFYGVICTFIVGGIAAIGFALFNRVLGRTLSNVKNIAHVLMFSAVVGMKPHASIEAGKSVGKLPYGVSIATGTIGYVVAKQLGFM
jgi:prepilin peptidase CpaA